jgi:ribulose-phosphate 3-epimerase
MHEIIPSPGTEDREWEALEKKILLVKPFVKTIHIDICDGKFAPNPTYSDPAPFKKYTKDLLFEVHLMVEEPIDHLKKWADAGFARFIGQIEMMKDQSAFIAEAQHWGEAALGVDGPTPLDNVQVNFADLDAILFYTGLKAGFSGKPFQEDRLEKVKKVRESAPFLPIEVDGGINDETILKAYSSGATRFVATSFLFAMDTPKQQFDLLVKQLEEI